MVDMINESARQTPVIAQTDVLVIGGGPAGLSAAIAAGRGRKIVKGSVVSMKAAHERWVSHDQNLSQLAKL